MKKIITFNDYMLEMISEAIVKDKLKLLISNNWLIFFIKLKRRKPVRRR
jgi:hypothetical protein